MERDDKINASLFLSVVAFIKSLEGSSSSNLFNNSSIITAPNSDVFVCTAFGNIIKGNPVSVCASPDSVEVMPLNISGLRLFCGFAEINALNGQPVIVRIGNLASLFFGLSLQTHYTISTSSLNAITLSSVPDGHYYRDIGPSINVSTIVLDIDSTIKQKGTMSQPAAIDNVTGAIIVDTQDNSPQTGIAGEAIAAGHKAIWFDTVTGKLFKLNGLLSNVQKFGGVTDGAAYALNDVVTYSPPGARLAGSPAGLNIGDNWASNTDGSLVLFSALTAGTFSRLVVDAQTTTAGVVVDGPIEQKST